MFDFSTYISPFTWRYGSDSMRQIFSENHKYELWRRIWVALAKAQYQKKIISKEEFKDLKENQNHIDIKRILEIEKDTKHDVVAAIREFAEKAKIGGGKIHLGATSMDIYDNSETLRTKEAIEIIESKVKKLLDLFCIKIENYIEIPCIGYTHLQPAEPTTLGYRFAFYAQDLFIDFSYLQFIKEQLKAKGLKGAVGTGASYTELLGNDQTSSQELESLVMKDLGLEALLITSQISTRKIDYLVLNLLSSISSTLAKFAGDLRILQSPNNGEWQEPFGEKQVGSSAMPFKKNPINSEKICSLARYIASLPNVALENATLSYLERTLDDSANRRVILAEGFLALDEILITAEKIISGLIINKEKIQENFDKYAPFAATESIIIESVKNGANRQEMHELLREISLKAWSDIQTGKSNPMSELLLKNKQLNKYLNKKTIKGLLNVQEHLGTSTRRSLQLVANIRGGSPLTYTSIGVNYDLMDPFKKLAQSAAKNTSSNLHQFSMNEVEKSRGESAYVWDEGDSFRAFVVEGLGTKNLIADEMGRVIGKSFYDQIAQDTVAMIINDLIVVGATPQVVNAYFAVGSSNWFLNTERAKDLVNGWAHACNLSGAVWGGGETPTLKGIVNPDTIDLAGSAIGIIKPKERLVTGEKLTAGDVILLIESSGIHANGLTLARTIASNLKDGYLTKLDDGMTYGEALLAPTHIYAKVISDLFENGVDIHYMVNITGHGWRKLMRATQEFSYIINQIPEINPLFKFIQTQSKNDDKEMYGNFNMGAGFALYIPEQFVNLAQQIIREKHHLNSWQAGVVEKGPKQVVIKPKNITYKGDTLGVR